MTVPALYVVATPIGNLDDISRRAVEILNTVALIAAEDTRHSKKLLQHYGIKTKLISLHEHNEQERTAQLLQLLQSGQSLALISDAGTPLISDPGYPLVTAVRAAGFQVSPIPGACAAIAALSAAGLPSDRFIFEGFLPAKNQHRQHRLQALVAETRTLIFYEAPHRIVALVDAMLATFGPERYVVIARELTKTFETIYGASLLEIKNWMVSDPNQTRGEFVVLVQGATPTEKTAVGIDPVSVLKILLAELPLKQAVTLAAKICGEKKNYLYELALQMR